VKKLEGTVITAETPAHNTLMAAPAHLGHCLPTLTKQQQLCHKGELLLLLLYIAALALLRRAYKSNLQAQGDSSMQISTRTHPQCCFLTAR
jgi:hypothetical protein